jgi:hypothetical protein
MRVPRGMGNLAKTPRPLLAVERTSQSLAGRAREGLDMNLRWRSYAEPAGCHVLAYHFWTRPSIYNILVSQRAKAR